MAGHIASRSNKSIIAVLNILLMVCSFALQGNEGTILLTLLISLITFLILYKFNKLVFKTYKIQFIIILKPAFYFRDSAEILPYPYTKS
jgi:hypothetical protein